MACKSYYYKRVLDMKLARKYLADDSFKEQYRDAACTRVSLKPRAYNNAEPTLLYKQPTFEVNCIVLNADAMKRESNPINGSLTHRILETGIAYGLHACMQHKDSSAVLQVESCK